MGPRGYGRTLTFIRPWRTPEATARSYSVLSHPREEAYVEEGGPLRCPRYSSGMADRENLECHVC
jgi:hypothetical protein